MEDAIQNVYDRYNESDDESFLIKKLYRVWNVLSYISILSKSF
jgi:hypothetical protein